MSLAGAVGCWWLWPGSFPWPQLALAAVGVVLTAFFRDPERQVPDVPGGMLAPADGRITDIVEVDEPEYLEGPALRIGIFLSIFDVHINRAPCAGTVEYVQERPGRCVNAMRARTASAHNQAMSVGLRCESGYPADKVLVRQITGAIARRIVCAVGCGDRLEAGQRFGMIKFGSRTELFLPRVAKVQVVVKEGDTVRAGTTVLAVPFGVGGEADPAGGKPVSQEATPVEASREVSGAGFSVSSMTTSGGEVGS